jgi:NADH:ubiquinone oxidoreductase subunit F (NADH-binding)
MSKSAENSGKECLLGMRNIGSIDPFSIDDYISRGGYEGFKKALAMAPEAVVKVIGDSGLRGRGGAGFPTGMKWKFTAASEGTEKYAVCNADEGEPGTFKDRVLMEKDPHSYLEGLITAAYAVGAATGYIYIRGEYFLSIRRTREAIDSARTRGFLGQNILGSGYSLDVHIKLGGGSYLCGEESALIESLEGKRGYPRIKPPYPAEKGVFDKPTVVNNVETLAHVPEIIRHGAEWYRTMGTEKSPGTKMFTLCGDIVNPGCYETEMGLTLETLLHDLGGGIAGGKKLKTVLAGGAAGTFIPASQVDVRMDFDHLKERDFTLGSGALIVMAEDRCVKDMLEDILRFFQHESCGKCVPCRVGAKQLLELINKDGGKTGKDNEQRVKDILELSDMMFKTSLCPLGQSPLFPVKSAVDHFKAELLEAM